MGGWNAELEGRVGRLLRLSRWIDALMTAVGRAVSWLVLVVCVVAAGTALISGVFGAGAYANALTEVQWLLFSAVFLLAAPWTLRDNEHIRIDILNHRLSKRTRDWIDVIGHALFLLPMAALVVWMAVPFARLSYAQHEGSSNAGGLAQWPLKMLIPVAFALLFVQGVSELIKRVAILRGEMVDPALGAPVEKPHDV
jgi:TRAP-type mannitol/chloroaromatic compound transport system permease small subunit